MTEEFESRNPVEVLAEEFLDRRTRGESTTVHEYVQNHPNLAAEISELFPMMIAMEQLKTSRFSSSGVALELQIDVPLELGDFRIIREIARGGMGVVYEAEQMSLNRLVALKIIPPQLLSDASQLARFQREARTAASLHHTNIVPVFGVGEQDGLRYYVMQKINGAALDCRLEKPNGASEKPSGVQGNDNDLAFSDRPAETDAARVSPQQRSSDWKFVADIGIQVAKALAYAHDQGVLHQDIKPGNLLLDPQGTVWVTDFGLATALGSVDQQIGDSVAGTLRFMAPEHLTGKSSARSDIYSLGVTLYELLTHQPAFRKDRRAGTIHRILNADFIPPRQLRPEIPADLEAIVLKAMACDPQQRYQDADQLATDLQRFVDDRTVVARPLTSAARIWRWGKRNPVVAGLSTSLLLGAVASVLLVGAEWRSTVTESRRAENNLSLALASMDQILKRFTSGWMAHPTTVADLDSQRPAVEIPVTVSNYSASVLEDSLRFYDKFAEQNATNPQLRHDTAKVHRRVGEIYARIGDHKKAGKAFRRSLQLLEAGTHDVVTSVQALEWAETLNELGLTLHSTSEFPEASVEFQNAIRILQQERFVDNPACQAEIARAELNLGQTLWLMGQRQEANKCHQHAIQLLEHLVSHSSEAVQHRLLLAHAYRIYTRFPSSKNSGRSRSEFRASGLEILEKLVSEFPAVPDYQCELSEMLTTSAPRSHHAEDAERAAELARGLVQTYPSIPRYRAALASALKAQAEVVQRTSPEDAEALFTESVDLYRQLAGNFRGVPVYRLLLSSVLRDYSDNARRRGDVATARERLREAISTQEYFVAARPDSVFGVSHLQRMRDELAEIDQSSEESADDR